MMEELLNYYDINKRDLPWRKTRDPYAIWISEILCQQTRVDTAIDYYNRFMKDYPTVQDLANASIEEIYKHWQGLGYYSRARNLHKAAQIIDEQYNGIFPKDHETILSLPGIGEYTASAISAMAYDEPYAAIDGNFFRVFTRFWMMDIDIAKENSKKKLREKLLPLLPSKSGDFNQAVMDLGATICLSNTQPKCELCPLNRECLAHRNHKENDYPISTRKTKVKELEYTVFLIKTEKGIVLHKRKDSGLLASLYEFPNAEGFLKEKEIEKIFPNASIKKADFRFHHFSHQTWKMLPYVIETKTCVLKEDEVFAREEEIRTIYSIPTCFSQFYDLLKLI